MLEIPSVEGEMDLTLAKHTPFLAKHKRSWLRGALILCMPILLIFFLASQMAYSQVKSRFEAYQTIPEFSRLSDLQNIPSGEIVLLKGEIAMPPIEKLIELEGGGGDLIIYQERPLDGREVRFQEEFPLVFHEFTMDLFDGAVLIIPITTKEYVIQGEKSVVVGSDRALTGFGIGDDVTVQGQWQAEPEPTLIEVTGISGLKRAEMMADWRNAFRQVAWVRNILGVLTLLSLGLLVYEVRQNKRIQLSNGD